MIQLSVLTQNTWLKPGLTGTLRATRIERLVRAVGGYDVVGLQETFSDDCLSLLRQSGYPYVFRQDRGDGFITLNSGLSTLTRYPITEWHFRKFTDGVGWDLWVRKGIQFSRLSIPAFGPINVFNTHVQDGSSESAANARRSNIREAIAFIAEHMQGYPTMLLGDFNMQEDSAEYTQLIGLLGPADTYRLCNPTRPGYTYVPAPDNPYNAPGEPYQRLDYIFLLLPRGYYARIQGSRVVNDKAIDGYLVSDHFGVSTNMCLWRER